MAATGDKGLAPDVQSQLQLLIFERRQQHRQEAPDHQVIDVPLRAAQTIQGGLFLGGDDGVVVRDFRVVYEIPGLVGPLSVDLLCQGLIDVRHAAAQALAQRGDHVLRDIARVGPRVGQQLVLFIQALHEAQGLFGRVGVFFVRVPLQLGQVIGRGRGRLLPALLHAGEHGIFSLQLRGQLLRLLSVKQRGISLRVPPVGRKARQLCRDAPELPGHEAADLLLAPGDEGEGRGLDPAGGELGPPFAGQGAGHVQAYQPVGLAAGLGRAEEAVVFLRRAQVPKALADGPVRLGRNPEAPGLPLPARLLQDPAGDQLPLPAGVGGNDKLSDVRTFQKAGHRLVLLPGFGDDDQFHLFGQHGQVRHVPFLPLFVIGVGVRQGHQVAQRPGDDILIAFDIAVSAAGAAQHPGKFFSDGGFLRQNQCFSHV